jgi:hypothetical protein
LKTKKVSNPEHPLEKSIAFTMYSNNSYTAQAYKNAMAQPRILIYKVKAGIKTVVWDKTYDFKYLRDYSTLHNRMFETVVINNVNSRETLEVRYVLTYYADGSFLQMFNDTVFNARVKSGLIKINV